MKTLPKNPYYLTKEIEQCTTQADRRELIRDLQELGCKLFIEPGRAGNEYTCIVAYPDVTSTEGWIETARTSWLDKYHCPGCDPTFCLVGLDVVNQQLLDDRVNLSFIHGFTSRVSSITRVTKKNRRMNHVFRNHRRTKLER